MTLQSFFLCECGSDILAIGHTWIDRNEMEEVGFVQNGGKYRFDEPTQLNHEHLNDEWIAYCGGCGKGVAVEWLPENRVKVLLEKQ